MFTTVDLLTIPYLVIFLVIIRKSRFFKDEKLPAWWFSSVFLLKVAAGTFLAAVYTYYYTDRLTADIYKYFDDSKLMHDALWDKPGDFFRMITGTENNTGYFNSEYYNHMNNWFRKYETGTYNDSHTIIRINAFIRIFSFGSYHVHTLFACFLSLAGLTAIYHAVKKISTGKKLFLAIAVFLFPSVLFWGSGVLKESFLLFGIGSLVYGIFLFTEKKSTFSVFILSLIGLILLLHLKIYVLLSILPGLIAFVWTKVSGHKYVLLKHLVVVFSILFAAAALQYIFPDNKLYHLLDQKQQDFINLSESVESGSLLHVINLEPDFVSFMKVAPLAFFNVLARPFPGESFSPFMLLASFENAIILTAILLLIFRFRRPDQKELNLIFLCLSFVIFLFVLIGWVTPVMGAIVRYKVPALPFLGVMLVMLFRRNGKEAERTD